MGPRGRERRTGISGDTAGPRHGGGSEGAPGPAVHAVGGNHAPGGGDEPLDGEPPGRGRQIHGDRSPGAREVDQVRGISSRRMSQAIPRRGEVALRGHHRQRHPGGIGQGVSHVAPLLLPTRVARIGARVAAVVRVHEDRIEPPEEALPHPAGRHARAAFVVRIREDDLPAVRGRWVGRVAILAGRHPVRRAGEQVLVPPAVVGRDPHRMLLGFRRLVAFHVLGHVSLPGARCCVALVADLVEHVVEVVHGIDDPAYVGLLEACDRGDLQRLRLLPLAMAVGVAVHAVDVVGGIERMPEPWVAAARVLVLDREAVEQHDRDVNAHPSGFLHALA